VWDEVSHLKGGLLLSRGQFAEWAFTNSFYPPAYDVFVALSFLWFGVSVFSARLVSVVFAVLSLFAVYGIAKLAYRSDKVALVATAFFSVMPGMIWLSKRAMIETLLVFVVSVSMFFFFRWLQTDSKSDQALSIAAFAFGTFVKYQVLVFVPIIMLLGTYFWKREYFKAELRKWFTIPRLAAVVAVAAVGLSVFGALLITGTLDFLVYAFGTGSQLKADYSTRYPLPVFYFVEMALFTERLHPISVLLYLLSLAGLAFMVYRRRAVDKHILLWFAVVYLVFTLVPNREWRYLTVAFPVLAIAASALVTTVLAKLYRISLSTKAIFVRWSAKTGAGLLIALVVGGMALSCVDAYVWIEQDSIIVPVEEASFYAGNGLAPNQTLMVVAAVNYFNKYMVSYYLSTRDSARDYNDTCQQYPAAAMDSFASAFSVSELVNMCQAYNTRYVLLFEYGKDLRYYQSELTASKIYDLLNDSGYYTLVETFGAEPNRIFVLEYNRHPQ